MAPPTFHFKAAVGDSPYEQRARVSVHPPYASRRSRETSKKTKQAQVTLPCRKAHGTRFYTDAQVEKCANFVRANSTFSFPATPSVCVPRKVDFGEAVVRGHHGCTEASFDSSRSLGFQLMAYGVPRVAASYLFRGNQIVLHADANADFFTNPKHTVASLEGILVHEMVHAAQASEHRELFERGDANTDLAISLNDKLTSFFNLPRFVFDAVRLRNSYADDGLILLEGHAVFIEICANLFFSSNIPDTPGKLQVPLPLIRQRLPADLPRSGPHVLGFHLVCRIKALQAELEDDGWLDAHGKRYKLRPSLRGDGLLSYLYENPDLIDRLLPYRNVWFASLRERVHLSFFRRLIIGLPGHVRA